RTRPIATPPSPPARASHFLLRRRRPRASGAPRSAMWRCYAGRAPQVPLGVRRVLADLARA
uniref:Uncharacterized protein n=1 Tax=Aegilops tauschii subsp. strangulata TaxID=200361 RepID=A0A453MD82_AEGTS